MRLTATISSYEQRHPASTVGNDAFCRKSHHSWLEHYTPLADTRPTHRTTDRYEIELRVRRGDRTRTCDPWSPRLVLICRCELSST